MEENQWKSVIRKFKRDLNGKVTTKAVTQYLQSIGYTVIFYQQGVENDFLLINNLVEYSKQVHAFTFCNDNCKIVFVDSAQSSDDVLCAILHEAAHILLGHMDCNVTQNKRYEEMQAEAFAYEVLRPANSTITEVCIVVLLALLLFLLPFAVSYITDNTTANAAVVYITPTGDKYHRKNCIFTKDKNVLRLKKRMRKKTNVLLAKKMRMEK